MALLDPLSAMKKYSPFAGGDGLRLFWGRVLANNDDKMLGRIKVQIHNLLPADNAEMLPWVYPLYPAGLGEGPLSSFFMVPEVDSYVICIFPHDSAYFGFYIGHVTDRLRRLTDFHSEYPERYGFCDSLENKWIVNKAPHVNTTEHRSSDGTLTVNDNRQSQFIMVDQYGTQIFIDRKKQTAMIHFAGVNIQISDGTLKVEGAKLTFGASNLIQLAGKKMLSMLSPVTQVAGDVMSALVKRFNAPKE